MHLGRLQRGFYRGRARTGLLWRRPMLGCLRCPAVLGEVNFGMGVEGRKERTDEVEDFALGDEVV